LADMHRRYRYAMAAFLAFEAQDIAHVFSKRTQNQQKSLFHQEEALQVRFKASSYLSRTRRVGVSTCPSGRLLWRHRAQPSATLDKRHPDFLQTDSTDNLAEPSRKINDMAFALPRPEKAWPVQEIHSSHAFRGSPPPAARARLRPARAWESDLFPGGLLPAYRTSNSPSPLPFSRVHSTQW